MLLGGPKARHKFHGESYRVFTRDDTIRAGQRDGFITACSLGTPGYNLRLALLAGGLAEPLWLVWPVATTAKKWPMAEAVTTTRHTCWQSRNEKLYVTLEICNLQSHISG